MADIYFNCGCGKSLAVDEVGAGRTVQCVDCGQPVQAPSAGIEFVCAGCGEKLLAASRMGGCHIKCTLCGYRMRVPDIETKTGIVEKEERGKKHVLPYAKLRANALIFTLALLTLLITGKVVRVLFRPRVMESAPESAMDFQRVDIKSAQKNTTDFQPVDMEPKRRQETNGGTVGGEQKIEPNYAVNSEQTVFVEHSHTDEETIMEYTLFSSGSAPEDELRSAKEKPVVEQEDVASLFEMPGNRETSFAEKPAVADMADTEAKDRLMELKKEYKAVEEARRGWQRAGQTPDFRKKVVALQQKTAAYVRTRDNENFNTADWRIFMRRLHNDYLLLTLQTYDECESAIRDFRKLLEECEPLRPETAARLSLQQTYDVVSDWAQTYPVETARLWDEEGARIKARDLKQVLYL